MCSTRYLSPSTSNNESTENLERSRTFRSTPHSPCCGSCSLIFRLIGSSVDFASGRLSARLDPDAFQIDESTCRELLFHCGLRQSLNSVINLGKRIALV